MQGLAYKGEEEGSGDENLIGDEGFIDVGGDLGGAQDDYMLYFQSKEEVICKYWRYPPPAKLDEWNKVSSPI